MSNINFFRLMGKNSGAATPSPPTCEEWYEEISSNPSSKTLSFPNSESFGRGGIYVDEGGTRLYLCDGHYTTNDLSVNVFQFSMSTAHNISTLSFVASGSTSFNSSDQGSNISGYGLHFSDDGTKLYRTISGKGALCRWDLSTAWDITSVNSTVAQRANFLPYLAYSSASINTVYSQSTNVSFTQDGLNLIMGHQQRTVGSQLPGPMYVKQYEMNTAWDLSSIVELSGSSVTYLSNTGSASSIYFYGSDIGYIDPASNNTDNFFVKNLDATMSRPVYQYYFTNGTGNNLVGKKNIGANGSLTFLKVVNKNYMYGIPDELEIDRNTIDWSDVCIPPTQFTPPPTPIYFNDVLGSVNNVVTNLTLDLNGKTLLSGTFTTIDGNTMYYFTRISSNGIVDTTFNSNLGTGYNVNTIHTGVLSTDDIIVSGASTDFNGTTIPRLSKLSDTGTLNTTFNTNLGTGFSGVTNAISVDANDKIIVSFTGVIFKGNTRRYIVRLNANGTEDTAFYSNLGTGYNSQPTEIKLLFPLSSNFKILTGGSFTSLNGNTRNYLTRLNANGTEDTGFYSNLGTAFNNGVTAIGVQSNDGKILIGGYFTSFNGNTRNKLVRLNDNGTEDTAFYSNLGTGFNGYPRIFIVQSSGRIIVGGNFTDVNGTTVGGLVALNSNGTIDTTFMTNFGSGVNYGSIEGMAEQSDGSIILSGNFSGMNGISPSINFIYKINSDGTRA